MGARIWIALLVCCLCFAMAAPGDACTSIRIKTTDGLVFYARTLEGETDFGSRSIAIVPKGTEYQGTLPDGQQKGMKWTVKYGFVGMSTLGLPLLIDGMNEKGLTVGNLFFPGFSGYQAFEPKESNKTMTQYEVLTWILGSFATVDEVKEAIKTIRVVEGPQDQTGKLELHYVIHDRAGNCAVIEYVGGQLKVYDNPIGVMTNSPPFDWHLINLRNHINISANNVKPMTLDGLKGSGLGQGSGMLGLPGDYTPPSRFVRMTALVTSALPVTGSDAGLNLAMTIIDNADIPLGAVRDLSGKEPAYDRTYWSVAADLQGVKYYVRTYDNKSWRFIDVRKALSKAKGMMNVNIIVPPRYEDVTETAKAYTLPAGAMPAGKP